MFIPALGPTQPSLCEGCSFLGSKVFVSLMYHYVMIVNWPFWTGIKSRMYPAEAWNLNSHHYFTCFQWCICVTLGILATSVVDFQCQKFKQGNFSLNFLLIHCHFNVENEGKWHQEVWRILVYVLLTCKPTSIQHLLHANFCLEWTWQVIQHWFSLVCSDDCLDIIWK